MRVLQNHLCPYQRDFPSPILLLLGQYHCQGNPLNSYKFLVPAENNELMNYIKTTAQIPPEECLVVASVVMFACSDIFRPDLGTTLIMCYVYGDETILLCSLKHWLPMNNQDLS